MRDLGTLPFSRPVSSSAKMRLVVLSQGVGVRVVMRSVKGRANPGRRAQVQLLMSHLNLSLASKKYIVLQCETKQCALL